MESEPTWNVLRDLGCTVAQGYYLSRPQPPDELAAWLMRRAAPQRAAS